MTRAILTTFHKYTPFGDEFYQPLFESFINRLSTMTDEYEKIYFLDSTWNFTDDDYEKMKAVKGEAIKISPHLRYYDAYKEVLPNIQEDMVLFMDNDMIVYKEGIISSTFARIHDENVCKICPGSIPMINVVSIMDTIGTWKSDRLKLGNKFCPYWFAASRKLLMKYLNIDWSPDMMPNFETLGKLTKAMVEDGLKVYEMEDDKNSIYFNGTKDGEKSKDLGYYHIRAGSTPAYLLATRNYGNKKTYEDYIRNQPQQEYLRQCAWYQYMGGVPNDILRDIGISGSQGNFWFGAGTVQVPGYINEFKKYHGLNK